MTRTHLIAVGACAVDHILTVPHFPHEDSKLRALSLTKRRGGNCPNSLEVLLQLVDKFTTRGCEGQRSEADGDESPIVPLLKLSLIATLPARSSPQIPFITSSFEIQSNNAERTDTANKLDDAIVDISRCIHRQAYTEPVSSYIICSQATSSRTIVNHNELPEMTFEEFIEATRHVLSPEVSGEDKASTRSNLLWFHFEGRIPETTSNCIRYLRQHSKFNESETRTTLRVSVELEKPRREGLQDLAYEADVVFYSRSWAGAEGYDSAEMCLKEQSRLILCKGNRSKKEQTLVCTWSDQGACALQILSHENRFAREHDNAIDGAMRDWRINHCPAHVDRDRTVLDTVGAGDTFIAGMLFGLICRSHADTVSYLPTPAPSGKGPKRQPVWSLEQKLAFANGLAGRKVLQHGFRGLGVAVGRLIEDLDHGPAEWFASAVA